MRKLLLLLCAFALTVSLLAGCNTAPAEDTDPVSDTVDTTEPPETPAETTEKPAETTEKPADTTAKPVETEKPAETTAKPVETEKPADTTAKPVETEKPAETTAKPTEPEKPAEITSDPGVDVDEIQLPENCAAVRPVSPVYAEITLDGKITEAEWGAHPDFRLDRDLTRSMRTYCRDYYGGNGNNISDMDYYWNYDGDALYVAVEIRDHVPFTTPAEGAEYSSHTHTLSFGMGKANFTVALGDTANASLADVQTGYTRDGDTFMLEVRIPLSSVGVQGKSGETFSGFIEDAVNVRYKKADGTTGGASITTRTTMIFANAAQTHDLFVLAPQVFEPERIPSRAEVAAKTTPVQPNGAFHLEFGDPIVLEQGQPGDRIWGHYNFPSLTRYENGVLRASWAYGRDSIYYQGGDVNPNGKNYTISLDDGKTWSKDVSASGAVHKNQMPNGKYFGGLYSKVSSREVDYLDKYTPAYEWGSGYRLYFAEDINEPDDITVYGREYDPATGKTETFEVTVNWPYMPFVAYPKDFVYPVGQMFSLSGGTTMVVDGELYATIYFYGFDSTAKTREEAVKDWCQEYSIFIFRSSDCGRTWDLIAQLPTDEKITGWAEGLCEPAISVSPDGTFVLLMRTGSANPMYVSYSKDKGETWSDPVKFDDFGVLPQLVTLDCGVMITSYGRPYMRVCATSDPSGIEWQEPVALGMSAVPGTDPFQTSCFYTDLLVMDGNTVLFIYTDFNYPNADGEPVKTVLVRTITVVPD